ncbi:PRC-barrel domain-containing protein [Streptomyces sp. 2P-4]|uniref:PRC-barrel domain-containing protein n=1 Tax=Streptomyces sp. 2P-4 TaxID=2931974 RepID=UPI0025410AA4|nr:PRC-barrel domain-containing protein [Streptomyces sp. 2P-4]
MKRFGEVLRMPVVVSDTAEQLGPVTGLVLAASPARVESLRMRSSRGDEFVPWEAVRSVGPDAVMVTRTTDSFAEADPDGRYHDPRGKALFTDRGQRLGEVRECTFDESDGGLAGLTTEAGEVEGGRLLAVGDFAVVVKDEEAPPESTD